jgi:ATP-dependent Zn protease
MMMNSTTEQHADAIVKNHTNSTDDSPSLAGTLSPDTSYEVSPTKNTAPVDDDIEQPTRQRLDKKDDYEVTSPKRKSRLWWCILVIAIALIIIAIPLAIAFSRPQATSGSSSNNNAMGSTPSPNGMYAE